MAKQSANPFDFDISKIMADFKVPGVDMESLMAAQRRNIEAVTAANKVAFESFQAVAKRQAEIVRQSLEEAQGLAASLNAAGAPQDKMAKQAELAKEAFERALANSRELAEMIARSNTEAAEVLQKRFSESLDELKASIEKAGKK